MNMGHITTYWPLKYCKMETIVVINVLFISILLQITSQSLNEDGPTKFKENENISVEKIVGSVLKLSAKELYI